PGERCGCRAGKRNARKARWLRGRRCFFGDWRERCITFTQRGGGGYSEHYSNVEYRTPPSGLTRNRGHNPIRYWHRHTTKAYRSGVYPCPGLRLHPTSTDIRIYWANHNIPGYIDDGKVSDKAPGRTGAIS